MSMPSVWKYLVGSASFAVLKQKTKLAWKCSILLMALSTLMELMVPSGFSVRNANKPIIYPVLLMRKKKTSSGPICAGSMSVGSAEGRTGFSPTKKMAGRTWQRYFFKRNPEVRMKMSQNLSIARAMGANMVQINKFFEEYRGWLADWKLEYAPNSIWNVDECGIGDVPKSTKVIGVTGQRPFQTVADEKATNTTMLTYISAGGTIMKPMLIFKNAKIKTEWREAAPSGYYLRASSSGYINSKLFLDYGKEFIKFLKEGHILRGDNKVILLMDLHKSHLFNWDFMNLMKDNNVEVCGFPPHCTHMLQPLDDTPYGNFKREYQKELMHMNRLLCGHRMSRQQFFRCFVPAFQTALTPETIRKGFKNCGIYPLDKSVPKLKNIGASEVYDRCKWVLLSSGQLCSCFRFSFRFIP